ncbi:hypothetical protein [Rariglobus hedericola]|uniref:Uncharacterized protein n=1 Tax=Rariglobus hedericola TaxID=2597822 RepID=A0A556QQE0_9BACT|nr:hypothetical protein [Rariglobus hedericola]TSJ78860.1 hypothetical protein FPL22_06030 [Rariglobus hedericola]
MKLCGHWLSLLWVAVTLMCPQIQASTSSPREETTRCLNQLQERPLPLISDFTLSDLKKTEDKKSEADRQPTGLMLPEQPDRFPDPAFRICGRINEREFHARCLDEIGLPLICGPPALA